MRIILKSKREILNKIAKTDFLAFITNYILKESDNALLAQVLWELALIQTKSTAITRLRLNITILLVRVSEGKFNKAGVWKNPI
mgnify:CR=1 FL=1